ncbi:aspartate kinase [Virgibacillus sediminis]|uniref:Aspartokinase n=1 Tax=Virgibacillus sediminis TaxID=202260 RepID=A0ABV7AB94_9BACI
MQILVQKFGGTSVRSEENRKHVIKHIKAALKKGYKLVAVVSALGRNPDPYATDTLLGLVDYPAHSAGNREMDLLMSCGEVISSVVLSNELQKEGIQTTALTGPQAGILTNEEFTRAKIKKVNPSRIVQELKQSDVVVVAGFQGATVSGEITTIGRGGSDTTAAAVGAALNAEYIDIFTDVHGIMTADPRVVDSARQLHVVTYQEICNLAYQGAKVIHPRAVEVAMQADIPIRIRSTYTEDEGTLVTSSLYRNNSLLPGESAVTGIAHMTNITQIRVPARKEEAYHLQSAVFKAMAASGISVDFINISPRDVIYTVPDTYTEKAVGILEELGFQPIVTENCTKVSAVGAGMAYIPGVVSKMVQAITNEGIQILQSADSNTTIWILIHEKDTKKAVNALHDVFGLSMEKSRYAKEG